MKLMLNDKINSSFGSKFFVLGVGEHTSHNFAGFYIKDDGTVISDFYFSDGTSVDLSGLTWTTGEVIYSPSNHIIVTAGTVIGYIS
jgi:hypothetical protein